MFFICAHKKNPPVVKNPLQQKLPAARDFII